MKRVFLLVCVMCLLALPVQPQQSSAQQSSAQQSSTQQWSAEQLAVWQTISKLWEMEMAGDDAWMELLHPSFQGWPDDLSMPLDKADVIRFHNAERGQFKIVVQDIHPVAIVVTGETAVAHYCHTTVNEYKDGERETTNGRSTDVLTRTAVGWRFVSWVHSEISEHE